MLLHFGEEVMLSISFNTYYFLRERSFVKYTLLHMRVRLYLQKDQYSILQQTQALCCGETKAYTWGHGPFDMCPDSTVQCMSTFHAFMIRSQITVVA